MKSKAQTNLPPQNKTRILVYLPLILSLIIFAIVARWFFTESIAKNQGHTVYSLDDAYIHMSIAKNIVQHGVWGVTQYEYAPASSSLLWTLLLSGVYKLTGPNEITPLVLNLFFSVLTIICAWYIFRFYHRPLVSPWYQFILLVLIVMCVPLVSLSSNGMENVAHTFLTLIFTGAVVHNLARDNSRSSDKQLVGIYIISTLLVMARYEGMFLVCIASLLFLCRKRWWQGVLVVLFGLLPVVVFGLLSIKYGGQFLPNSVLLKGGSTFANLSVLDILKKALENGVNQLSFSRILLFPFIASIILFIFHCIQRRPFWQQHQTLPLIFIMVTALHVMFAKIDPHCRYGSYIIALGIVALGLSLRDFVVTAKDELPQPRIRNRHLLLAKRTLVIGLSILALIPLFERTLTAHGRMLVGTTNIYHQQYQMAKFLQEYYPTESVAANDIGAITYFSDIHLLDLAGLANTEIAKLKFVNNFDAKLISQISKKRNVRIAMIYESWHTGSIPPEWSVVGRWTIPYNAVCGDDTVTFYAVDLQARPQLSKAFTEYSAKLPPGVKAEVYP